MPRASDGAGRAAGLAEAVERHPWGAVLMAAGIGYVIAGGARTSLTAAVLGIGIRAVMVPLIKNEFSTLTTAALAGRFEIPAHNPARAH